MNNNPQLGDQDILMDILSSQKFVTENYNTYTNECANPNVRDEFLNILREEHMIQADVFTEMQKRGWYPLQAADQQQVNQTRQKFQNMSAQM